MRRLLVSFIMIMILSGCNTNEVDNGVFEYKDSYVGDNSDVENIINNLREDNSIVGFQLITTDEPYGIIVNYDGLEDEKIAVYYATYLFTLVVNVEWITIHFDDADITITRDDLQDWYNVDLSKFTSEEELEELIEDNAEEVNEILNSVK